MLKAQDSSVGLTGKSKRSRTLFSSTEVKQQTISRSPSGKSYHHSGDTAKPCSVRLAVNADVLVHESAYGRSEKLLIM